MTEGVFPPMWFMLALIAFIASAIVTPFFFSAGFAPMLWSFLVALVTLVYDVFMPWTTHLNAPYQDLKQASLIPGLGFLTLVIFNLHDFGIHGLYPIGVGFVISFIVIVIWFITSYPHN
jgi:hypothetical protein